jgi:hypothetical protein
MEQDDRVSAIIQRATVLGEPLNAEDKKILQRSLYGLAPSSTKYKQIYSLLRGDGPAESSYKLGDGPPGPTFQGPPTLDFLNLDHKGMNTLMSTPAHGRDAWSAAPSPSGRVANGTPSSQMMQPPSRGGQAQTPPGVETPLDEVFNNSDRQYSGGFHGPGTSAMDTGSDIADEVITPESILASMPEGYITSDMSPAQIAFARQDPRVLAEMYAEAIGGGANTANFIAPWVQSADAMSQSGILGGPTRDSTIFGGPTSDVQQMAQIEDVIEFMNQPGMQYIDPSVTYARSMERLGNTDFSDYTDAQGQSYDIDTIIEISNSALMSSAPFMSETAAAALSAQLKRAGVMYKTAIATGEISMEISYPAYLKMIEADKWMGQ